MQGGGQQWTATPALQGGGGRDPGGGQPGGWWPWLILLGLLAGAAGGLAHFYLPRKKIGNIKYDDFGTQPTDVGEAEIEVNFNPKEIEIDKQTNWGHSHDDDFPFGPETGSSTHDMLRDGDESDHFQDEELPNTGSDLTSKGVRPKRKWPF